jgi:hypothetical protein
MRDIIYLAITFYPYPEYKPHTHKGDPLLVTCSDGDTGVAYWYNDEFHNGIGCKIKPGKVEYFGEIPLLLVSKNG